MGDTYETQRCGMKNQCREITAEVERLRAELRSVLDFASRETNRANGNFAYWTNEVRSLRAENEQLKKDLIYWKTKARSKELVDAALRDEGEK